MNINIINDIKAKLSESEGLKSCTVKIKPDAWLMALIITNINNTKLQLITHNDSYGFYNMFESEQFLIQTYLKLKDIEIIHEAFKIMRQAVTEEKLTSEWDYIKVK